MLVLLTQNDQARLFSVVLEAVHELDSTIGHPLFRSPRGRSSKTREKRELEMKQLNVKAAVDELMRPPVWQQFDAFCLAGPDEARSKVKQKLPKELQGRVKAEITLPLDLPVSRLADELRSRT